MDNKELDEILNEIKQHSLNENEPKPVEAPAPKIFETQNSAKPEEEPSFKIDKEEIEPPAPPLEESELSFSAPEIDEIAASPEDKIDEGLQEEENQADFMSIPFNEDGSIDYEDEDNQGGKKSKKPLIIAIAIILIAALGVGIYFGFFHKKDDAKATTKAAETTQVDSSSPVSTTNNPLTGEAEYNTAAVGKRPAAVVVENEYGTASVKPQWGISEADIVLEGESEYSTRLLMFWADYTDMPAQVGPARSARPPFIRFSQLFDSIFIHAGLSRTKGNYIGANTVFKNENIDHINLLTCSEDGKYFGRDKSRTSTIEHTGFLNGENAAELIEKQNFRTDIDSSRFTAFEFNEKPQALSDKAALSVKFVWSDVYSSGHCPKVGKYYYDESNGKYSTNDFDSDFGNANLEFENLIFLLDTTEYIVKENYKNGQSETYCDYKLSGGTGMVLSEGTALDITWGVENGKLWMKDANGNSVKLNPGKSYIGYGSSNKGGSVTIE